MRLGIQLSSTTHTHLQTIVGKTIEASRIKGTSLEILQKWFDAFEQEVLNDPQVTLENIYNMNESRFSIGVIKAGHVIIDSRMWNRFQAQPGRQKWVTMIESICGDGTSISLYIIFKEENINMKWISNNIDESWIIEASANGWTSNEDGLKWLQTAFEPATREKTNGQP